MNPRISNKVLIQNIKYNFKRFLSTQYKVNKNSYHRINNNHKNENQFSCFGLSIYNSQKHLRHTAIPYFLNLQRRNMSNEAVDQQVSKKLSASSTTEEITSIPVDNIPSFINTFAETKIVELAQQTLLKVHEITGLPWWATIALTAFLTRTTITLPFSMIQMRNTAKLQLLKPEMDEIVKRCKSDASYAVSYHGWSESLAKRKYQRDVRQAWKELIVRHNCHPFKSYILVLIQIPVWISFSFATRNLCYMIPREDPVAQLTYFEMMVGGFGWIENLTQIDHYMILPIISMLINLSIIEINLLFREQTELTRLQRFQRNLFRFISIVMLPIAMYIPAGTLIYWVSSSTYGLLQTFLLHSTRLRRLIGIPFMESQSKHPYRLFYNNLKSRLHLTSK